MLSHIKKMKCRGNVVAIYIMLNYGHKCIIYQFNVSKQYIMLHATLTDQYFKTIIKIQPRSIYFCFRNSYSAVVARSGRMKIAPQDTVIILFRPSTID